MCAAAFRAGERGGENEMGDAQCVRLTVSIAESAHAVEGACEAVGVAHHAGVRLHQRAQLRARISWQRRRHRLGMRKTAQGGGRVA